MAESQQYRLIFMGAPDFAVRVLQHVARWPLGQVVAVYTSPDRPAGRGYKLKPPPVKVFAQHCGFPVLQPTSLNTIETQQEFANLCPDFLLVASYGLLLPDAVLRIPRFPPLNVHPSLLPRYRGAAPVQRAVLESWHDGATTGVSVMRIESRLDAGPVYAASSRVIGDSTSGELLDVLADKGARLLLRVMEQLLDGTARADAQDERLACYAAKILKEDARVDWSRPAAEAHARIRAMTPLPGAWSVFDFGEEQSSKLRFVLWPGKPTSLPSDVPPGAVLRDKHSLMVACGDHWYELSQVKPQGGAVMPIRDMLNGRLRHLPQGLCGRVVQSQT
ncbi:MAG: methionyl-tRNA formyltransferase [Desulfovibrio sp.]|jgi:methionyl-tRNA formyltransferase|nr:methionyl-tRNA formyltransferase [Desulfovibrio sp.]